MALVEKWLVEPFAKGLVEPYTSTAILYGIKTMFFHSSNRNSELGLFGFAGISEAFCFNL